VATAKSTLGHLRAEGFVEAVELGGDERGLVLTKEGRDLLDSHTLKRDDEAPQAFYAGVSRPREIDHDSNLYATYRQEEARLRDEHGGLDIRRVILEQDLKREYQESIDLGTYERQRDRLREELTLVEIDRHGSKVEEFDVEGILNFAERVLPRASDLWIQASLEQRQRLQRLFFPEGVAFSGKSFDRTVVTSSLFEYLRPLNGSNENLVAQNIASWNQITDWLRRLDSLRETA
jgi:hypothetical protein